MDVEHNVRKLKTIYVGDEDEKLGKSQKNQVSQQITETNST